MRVVVCGDAHIGAVFGLGKSNKKGGNTRIDDYENTINYIADYCIENKIDVFIQTGDAFDSRTPAQEHLEVMDKVLKKLSMANITSIVIMGNHDYKRAGDSFTSAITSLSAKDYPNVRLILNPELLKFYDYKGNETNILLIPFRDRRMYQGKTTEEDSNLYQQHVSDLLNECQPGMPTIAVGHNFFYEGSYNDFGGVEILVKPSAFEKCDMVVMGHYHTFKILKKKNPIAFYIGSMEKLNFGDQSIDKFFIDFDTITKQVKVLKCPTRQLLDFNIDLSDISIDFLIETFKEKISQIDFKEKIIRLRLIVKDNLISSLNKNEIEKILYEQGAYFVSKVLLEPVITRMIRNESVLEHKNDYDMFEAFVKNQLDLGAEESNLILTQAKKIIEE